MRRDIVVADGTTVSYAVVDGAEPTVVILHGLAGSGREFELTASSLTGRRVILIDDYFRSWPVPFADRTAAAEVLGAGPLAQAWIADLEERADGLFPRFDPDVMVATIAEVAVPRWTEWEQVAAPTLVIYAENGMFIEQQKTDFVARGSNVARTDLAGASHDAHLDAFDGWAAALRSFLEVRDAPPRPRYRRPE